MSNELDLIQPDSTEDAGVVDSAKLTESEKALLLAERENESEPEQAFYTTPDYLVNVTNHCSDTIRSIFPDATPEQLAMVKDKVLEPVLLGLLHEVGFHVTVLSENASPALRNQPVVDPITRFITDHSITALYSVVHGIDPTHISKQYLESTDQLDDTWTVGLEGTVIPPNGLPIEFVLDNKIHRGKICYYTYLTEDASTECVTDVPAFWSNDLRAYIYTHAVAYWRELKAPVREDESPVIEGNGDTDAAAE